MYVSMMFLSGCFVSAGGAILGEASERYALAVSSEIAFAALAITAVVAILQSFAKD